MEEQAMAGEDTVDDARLECVPVAFGGNLSKARERIDRMQSMFSEEVVHKFQRELEYMRGIVKRLEDDQKSWGEERKRMEDKQVSWGEERESMAAELRKLRSEVEEFQAAAAAVAPPPPPPPPQICDIDRGSEEIDLKALAEHKWYESRPILAPITPETIRARTPATKQGALTISGSGTPGKENVRMKHKGEEGAEQIQHLRRENEHLRQKMSKISKEYKGLKSQYCYLQTRVGSKGDVGHLISNQDHLQAALEAGLEKPSKIRRRSSGDVQTQGGVGGYTGPIASNKHVPSNPMSASGIRAPQAVAEIITAPTPSTSGSRDFQAKVKAEPVCSESFKATPQISSAKKSTTGVYDAELDRKPDSYIENSGVNPERDEFPLPITSNRKRSLEPTGKQPAKLPAFKFVEPVRKKADREGLQATECKLCKKFYDAVISGDANGLVGSRCNHLDKSRHRYRDLPPATPDGFWNIGFDSDF